MDTKAFNKRKDELLDQQTKLLLAAQDTKRHLTADEKSQFDNLTKELDELNDNIKRVDAINRGKLEVAIPREAAAIAADSGSKKRFMAFAGGLTPTKSLNVNQEYVNDFWKSCKTSQSFSAWQIKNAALGEGGTAADGSALVPIMTDPTIPALQIVECSARSLSTVIPTDRNINFPYQSAKATAAVKAESNNSSTNAFATSVPQFSTTELTAYNVGDSIQVSWELLEDSAAVNSFIPAELQRAVRVEEEYLFINGTGSSQPQGYLGNATTATGAHITNGAATLGINPILETTATLNANYYQTSSWLVNRQEFVRLIEAQVAANQFQTYMTFNDKGGATLLGWPVFFSAEMGVYPSGGGGGSPAGEGNWLFGSFKDYAIIGDRGGSELHLRVDPYTGTLDAVTYIVGYRRTDQRIILSEAVVQLNTNA